MAASLACASILRDAPAALLRMRLDVLFTSSDVPAKASSIERFLAEQCLGLVSAPDQVLVVRIFDEALDVGAVAPEPVRPRIASEQLSLLLEIVAPPGEPRPVRILEIAFGDRLRLVEHLEYGVRDPWRLAH